MPQPVQSVRVHNATNSLFAHFGPCISLSCMPMSVWKEIQSWGIPHHCSPQCASDLHPVHSESHESRDTTTTTTTTGGSRPEGMEHGRWSWTRIWVCTPRHFSPFQPDHAPPVRMAQKCTSGMKGLTSLRWWSQWMIMRIVQHSCIIFRDDASRLVSLSESDRQTVFCSTSPFESWDKIEKSTTAARQFLRLHNVLVPPWWDIKPTGIPDLKAAGRSIITQLSKANWDANSQWSFVDSCGSYNFLNVLAALSESNIESYNIVSYVILSS